MVVRLSEIQHLLIDMDGVLYRGQTALPGGADLIRFLEEHAIRYLLVTNNSTLTQAQFVARLRRMGIEVHEDAVMTSAVATAEYLAELASPGTRVNVIGEEGLLSALKGHGFQFAGRDADFVVCGWDRQLTFEKLKTACLAIRAGATFIGTNPDKTYPLEDAIIPGNGSALAYLVAATDVEPIVVGKPEPIIIEQCLRVLGARHAGTAILGDRLDTDILGGHRAGIATLMVLTGISSKEEAAVFEAPPDAIFSDLSALIDAWSRELGKKP